MKGSINFRSSWHHIIPSIQVDLRTTLPREKISKKFIRRQMLKVLDGVVS